MIGLCERVELVDAAIMRGPASGHRQDVVAEAVETAVADGTGTNTGAVQLSGMITAGGQGNSLVVIEVPSANFDELVAVMFAANRDRAIRAFGRALEKTPPIAPVGYHEASSSDVD